MIDVAAARIGADDKPRDAQAVAVLVDDRRHHMIVKPPESSQVRKIAVLFQSGPCITALIKPVTYAMPVEVLAGGCSLTIFAGQIHATDGNVPFFAAA